jgi:hypothetical protein
MVEHFDWIIHSDVSPFKKSVQSICTVQEVSICRSQISSLGLGRFTIHLRDTLGNPIAGEKRGLSVVVRNEPYEWNQLIVPVQVSARLPNEQEFKDTFKTVVKPIETGFNIKVTSRGIFSVCIG